MPAAAVLGMCLLLPWLSANIVLSVPEIAVWQSTQSQENQPSNSPEQGSLGQPPTNQQKASDQSVTPPQPPSIANQPCPENSQPGSSTKSDCKPPASTGAKTKKHHRTVVRNGGTADPTVALSPGLSPQQASRQIESTKRLLAASDANLKKISGRQLSANQQDTVKQIKSYMDQANTAKNDRDFQRAYNLAVKANLLSAELVGH
jgi:hypothetical protein